jgi:hypothetical protein
LVYIFVFIDVTRPEEEPGSKGVRGVPSLSNPNKRGEIPVNKSLIAAHDL